jgi:hypothetical protein
MSFHQTGITTGETKTSYLVRYGIPVNLISNREYEFSMEIYDNGSIFNSSSGDVRFYFESDVKVIIVRETAYTETFVGEWQPIRTVIKLEDNTGLHEVNFGILIKSIEDVPLIKNFQLFVDDINYRGSDILKQDETKRNLKVEKYFSESFIGGIQKLRIYDNALSSIEVLHNAIIESTDNSGYNLKISKGGRIIYV